MDEFAQSREDDDLFADEFEPVTSPVSATTPAATIEQAHQCGGYPVQPRSGVSQQQQQKNLPRQSSGQQQRGGRAQGGGRGGQDRRGRGGQGGSNGLNNSRYAPRAPAETVPVSQAKLPSSLPQPSTQAEVAAAATTTVPTAPETRIHAVRGDRSATGGPAHKKLTEQELSEKMAKMAILNKERAEKHRLTQADQAAFQHREKELAKERKEKAIAERKNERVMEMERAKNRQRKMKAQGGREWDSVKLESDVVDRTRGRTSEFVRGGHGGVIRGGLAGSRHAVGGEHVPDSQASRGRGSFEIRGQGRGGRSERGGRRNAAPVSEDFPSLPSAKKSDSSEPLKVSPKVASAEETAAVPASDLKIVAAIPEVQPAGDWAEEMATPIEVSKP